MKSIRFLSIILGCSAAMLAGTAVAAEPTVSSPAQPHYTYDSCVNAFDPAKKEKTTVGYQYWYAGRDLATGWTVKLSVVGPHLATHQPHVHDDDEYFIIIAGQAELYLFGKWHAIGPNTCVYVPPGVEHGLRNAGDTELKYIVFQPYAVPAAATPTSPK
jgi:mannose-6-phosphate isomerase-like protein (cupin superfamily)